MGLSAGILLTAVGALLAFAAPATVSGLDIRTVGWILMAVGVLGVVLDLAMFAPRRRRVTTSTYATAVPSRTVVRQDEVL